MRLRKPVPCPSIPPSPPSPTASAPARPPARGAYLDRMAPGGGGRARRARICPAATRPMPMPRWAPTRTRWPRAARPNIGIVTAYNDMLSAHQPYRDLPRADPRRRARAAGATAQVAGGVPAMCDGVTQGQPGMELSLFSRDVIALAAGVALSPQHLRRRALSRRLRQDRAGPGHRGGDLRPYAGGLRARRADDHRPPQRRESPRSASLRRRRGRPRRR